MIIITNLGESSMVSIVYISVIGVRTSSGFYSVGHRGCWNCKIRFGMLDLAIPNQNFRQ